MPRLAKQILACVVPFTMFAMFGCSSADDYEETPVYIYSDANYSGAFQGLTLGAYDTGNLEIGNDQLSSIQVAPGFKVILFEHSSFQGATMEITSDTDYVGYFFNDETSSIIVE